MLAKAYNCPNFDELIGTVKNGNNNMLKYVKSK